MEWFTSDTHFCHANVIKYCNRPFANVDEMDEALIKNWNSKVKPGDTVYHTGDFGMAKDVKRLENILRRLNGQKWLIRGNHDYPKFLEVAEKYFVKIKSMHTVKVKDDDAVHGRQLIVLCHYGLRVWDKSHFGSYCLHGHSHGTLPPMGLSVDIGVDSSCITGKPEYRPFSYDEIKKFMKNRKIEQVDHHGKDTN